MRITAFYRELLKCTIQTALLLKQQYSFAKLLSHIRFFVNRGQVFR